MSQSVTDATFEQLVLKSDKPVLVDFWAEWCGPCRVVGPILEDISKERQDITILKLDVDANQNTAMQYNVMSIPTMILFKNGQPVDQLVGAMPKDPINRKINEVVAA
jgi:thioredoxin 1